MIGLGSKVKINVEKIKEKGGNQLKEILQRSSTLHPIYKDADAVYAKRMTELFLEGQKICTVKEFPVGKSSAMVEFDDGTSDFFDISFLIEI